LLRDHIHFPALKPQEDAFLRRRFHNTLQTPPFVTDQDSIEDSYAIYWDRQKADDHATRQLQHYQSRSALESVNWGNGMP
jgi:hypothetical protein